MRHVLQSDEIATAWALQTQPSARCSASMSFNGPTFYSYGTVIAAIVEHDGKTAFLVTNGQYSSTTSAHVGRVRCAIPKGSTVFTIPAVEMGGHGFTDFKRILVSWTLQGMIDATVTREPKKTSLIITAYQTLVTMREFAAFFNLSLDKYPVPLPMSEEAIQQVIRDREAQAIENRRIREERAQMGRVMRRLQPDKEITTRDVYKAWQAAKANA